MALKLTSDALMILLLAKLTVLEVAVFSLTAIAFVIALRFFLQSRKKLQEFLPYEEKAVKTEKKVTPKKEPAAIINVPAVKKAAPVIVRDSTDPSDLKRMKEMIMDQQEQLNRALSRLNDLQPLEEERETDAKLEKKVSDLELLVDKRDAELKSLRQQVELSKKMQVHFDELQSEFELLQDKLPKLEQQAWEAKELTMKLESMEQSYQHLEKELIRKEEKLLEVSAENQRLHSELNETEDKLQEAVIQRQQLMKKLQFVEEMNTELKQVAETNRKLQNEIRRIAELESMLNLIIEERDELLKLKYR